MSKVFKARDASGDTIEISLDDDGLLVFAIVEDFDGRKRSALVLFEDGQKFLAALEMTMCQAKSSEFDIDEMEDA